jgi:hypothetical protein
VIFSFASSRTAFLSAVRFLVHGRPSATLCFVVQDTAAFVAFFDVVGQRSRRAAPVTGTQNRCKDKTADGALTVVKAGKNSIRRRKP